ncbi:carbohydrate kinase [Halanaerobiaceae bacterium Z-7014]|uniref:Carbohydrate kinase n=1 Tax=Halonatronomonas betaini TaxID=2778430 RepID=A0A931AQ80_9FIRM|nr:carbohydrate kinase [Halonatronomonas betaini]MBF8436487.1 carbohydrate kinase [Halonatronomonas betaini]
MEFRLDKPVDLSDSEIDLLAVGEVLIDLISQGEADTFLEAEAFERYFGGSPANIAMNLARLGKKSALISRVGFDGLGEYLLKRLGEAGVITDSISVDRDNNTTVIMVTRSRKSPKFIAYRGAEKFIDSDEIKDEDIRRSKIIHLSTFALSAPESRRAIEKIINIASDQNKVISLDPNYRPQLWEGTGDGIEYIKNILPKIDIIKPSLDDAEALFGQGDVDDYIKLFHESGCKLVILTLGAEGLLISAGDEIRHYDSLATRVVDTTGAGDAFWSGFYTGISSGYDLELAVQLGNSVAAEVIKEVGAIIDLPDERTLIEKYNLKGEG